MQRFLAQQGDAGKRFDRVVAQYVSGFSHAAIRKAIKSGWIFLNGKPAKPSVKMKMGDHIAVTREPETAAFPTTLTPDRAIPLTVIYEDRDVIVVDKPAGLSVHPSLKESSGTLANALIARFPSLKKVGEDPLRPGIVHRLDKYTSGLLAVAKNQKTFFWLKEQFAHRSVEKRYLALVRGYVKAKGGTIVFPLVRTGAKQQSIFRKSKLLTRGKVRQAETEFRVLKHFGARATLLLVRPKTGRTHQIRAHLSALGHPIIGDTLYGSKKGETVLGRFFLHATHLEFSASDGRRFSFESELPPELQDYLAKLHEESSPMDKEREVRYE